MTTWFVSRHLGALQWMREHGPQFDQHVPHLQPEQVVAGDVVIGTLPVHLAAQVCDRGAEYWHLSLELPQPLRGVELSSQELQHLGASLKHYTVKELA